MKKTWEVHTVDDYGEITTSATYNNRKEAYEDYKECVKKGYLTEILSFEEDTRTFRYLDCNYKYNKGMCGIKCHY